MVMASECELGGWGSIPGWSKSLTPRFVFKYSSDMMVTTVRMGGCADHMNKKLDLIIKNKK